MQSPEEEKQNLENTKQESKKVIRFHKLLFLFHKRIGHEFGSECRGLRGWVIKASFLCNFYIPISSFHYANNFLYMFNITWTWWTITIQNSYPVQQIFHGSCRKTELSRGNNPSQLNKLNCSAFWEDFTIEQLQLVIVYHKIELLRNFPAQSGLTSELMMQAGFVMQQGFSFKPIIISSYIINFWSMTSLKGSDSNH